MLEMSPWFKKIFSYFRTTAPIEYPGELLLLNPQDYASKHLTPTPQVILYLPKNWKQGKRKYPVLYAHDGQNLFDPKTSFAGAWYVGQTIEKLQQQRLLDGVIVVGIYNNGAQRVHDYTPTNIAPSYKNKEGGNLYNYGKFIVDELKPYLDKKFPTLSDRKNTGIMGSSLGGLASFYLLGRYSEIFGKAAILSPSFWWDDVRVLKDIDSLQFPQDVKIYLDGGWYEGSDEVGMVTLMRKVYQKLKGIGLEDFKNIFYHEDPQGNHNEKDWARRLHQPIFYLYGKFSSKIEDLQLTRIPKSRFVSFILSEAILSNSLRFTALSTKFTCSPTDVTLSPEGELHLPKSSCIVHACYQKHTAEITIKNERIGSFLSS